MVKDDSLWKGILENVFDDFLFFFFDNADELFDIEKGFQFLDKELEQLFPMPEGEAPKFVDKLVKVFRKEGIEEWMLIHIEVQGYDDKDFAKRMFTYFYRILDKYGMPITAFAIFTDTNKKFHPKAYEYHSFGTSNIYTFNTYKVIEQDEALLEKDKNPFAIVILTVLVALKLKKINDDDLLNLKLQIFRNLYRRDIDDRKMRGLLTFLNFYVHFAKPETNSKFEKAIDILTENNTTMGIEEFVLDRARKQGLEEAKIGIVKNLLLADKFTIAEIANFTNVTEAFVIKVKNKMNLN